MKRISAADLRALRNDLDVNVVIDALDIPTRRRGTRRQFRCPDCSGYQTSVSPHRNLAWCFDCDRGFNPIDLVMSDRSCSFLDAIDYLEALW